MEDLIKEEQEMALNAEKEYGEYFVHAKSMVTLFNNLVTQMNIPTRFMFLAFFSQIRKHLVLALLSTVRLHHVQAGMNLRQVLEASGWAAYALAHENEALFWRKNSENRAEVPKSLKEAKNTWLENNYKDESDKIRILKELINESIAHANIVYAFQTFELADDENGSGYNMPYFDIGDHSWVKMNLLTVANFTMSIIGLFIKVNQKYNVYKSPADLNQQYQELIEEHENLRTKIQQDERFRQTA
ncbi:MAG TPA: hypothetical protein VGE63_00215 [Candidatus Paceibacterota bacterium]